MVENVQVEELFQMGDMCQDKLLEVVSMSDLLTNSGLPSRVEELSDKSLTDVFLLIST